MKSDPYKVLGLDHDATAVQIKRAYRKFAMKLHPDRLISRGAAEEVIKESTTKFAAVTAAYSLLSDRARKQQYDHIYKYGGYEDPKPTTNSSTSRPHAPSSSPSKTQKSQKGIGYTFTDPVAYLLSQGKVKSRAVAGISIPSRMAMGHPSNNFRFSVSSGKAKESDTGSLHVRSMTTQFSGGKKYNKVETTTIHRDGRKEVIIEGDDYVERRYSTTKRKIRGSLREDAENLSSKQEPWHAQLMKEISANLQRCTSPSLCGAISVR